MSDFADFKRRCLRLTMLKALADERNFTANEVILQAVARAAGLSFSREAIRTEMKFLESLGALELKEFGSVLVATLRQRGRDHVEGLAELDGVELPSPKA